MFVSKIMCPNEKIMKWDHESGFRDQLPCQNVKNLHIKNILHLNRNYKLFYISTKIANLQTHFLPR